jgi:hypothetical protein
MSSIEQRLDAESAQVIGRPILDSIKSWARVDRSATQDDPATRMQGTDFDAPGIFHAGRLPALDDDTVRADAPVATNRFLPVAAGRT